ncbi:MAG TPA: HNH endonuclease [Pyrinomonadaceae bacterium]|jgi:predicted restriction endonuclease
MKLETEKRYLVLLSITELGGSATKKAVLDNILDKDYFDFTDNDLKKLDSRAELTWRNDLAYIRDHLKSDGYIDGNEKNKWKITAEGTAYLKKISEEVIASNNQQLKKISPEAVMAGFDLIDNQQNQYILESKSTDKNSLEQNFGGTAYAQIRARRGQKKFRNGLIQRYGSICLITECQIIDLIEAAHIIPFKIEKSHNLDNGLLLRSDIHTLFDLNLIGINKEFIVHLHPKIVTEYSALNKKQIIFNSAEKPNLDKIDFKWNEFIKHSYLK